MVGALGRHIALVGFMGAGKTTIGREVARLTERSFVDLDEEIERRHGPIPRIFEEQGEAEFRRIEHALAAEVLGGADPMVVALGGGAVTSEAVRDLLALGAFTVWIEIDVGDAWRRVSGSDRPLARDQVSFRRLFRERQRLYLAASDDIAENAEDVLLACLEIEVWSGGLFDFLRQNPHLPVIADENVFGLYLTNLARDAPVHVVPPGERAKDLAVVQHLWSELGVGRSTTIVGMGGGSTTDVAGFVAATYMRGVPWVALPTTLTGQVDAAIGGKTGIDLPGAKNLVGAFHFPYSVVVDPDVLATLPDRERRAGMAEVVKTGLLAGRPLWELPEDGMIRGAAAFKAAVVLADPFEQTGRRTILNLGHTFAHALEAASGYELPHGEAVALGLKAALRLSGMSTEVVDEVLRPEPVRVDADAAWAALKRDKKGEGVFVLLEGFGQPAVVNLSDEEVRPVLDSLIAK